MLKLDGAEIARGLSSIQKTAGKYINSLYFNLILLIIDGQTYAFSTLDLSGKKLSGLGDSLAEYEHLRNINLSKNDLDNIDKLRSLKYI